jgi:hypothetical protein
MRGFTSIGSLTSSELEVVASPNLGTLTECKETKMTMKVLTLAGTAFALCLISAPPAMAKTMPAPAQATTVKETAFACDTLALDPASRKRHFDVLGPELVAKRIAVRELPSGYEFTFASDAATFSDLVEWVGGEKACCPFFNFSLNVAAEHGPVKLQITGRPGTKAFMRSDGADWVKPILASK